MPKLVRRHPTFFGLIGTVAVVAAALWWSATGPPPARATPAAAAVFPPSPPLDPVIAGEIDMLRLDLGLTNDALNVLNLEDPGALLSDMKDWYTTNRDALAARRQAIADLRAQIRLHQSAINNGQDQSAALATARTELARAEAGIETFLNGLRESAFSRFTADQQATITRMKTQRDLPMPYRALPLTVEQSNALKRALLHQEQRRSTAGTVEHRAEILTQFQQERDDALGATNLQLLASMQAYLGASSERVVAALNEVLPREAED